jgi:EpsI family protein
MNATRRALVASGCMAGVAALTAVARHRVSQGIKADPPRLAGNIPEHFGPWRVLPTAPSIVNPQAQQALDAIYSELVARTYIDTSRYAVMLSVAYGHDQRGGLQAHRPEVCYPAQGFTLHEQFDQDRTTPHGPLRVRRLRTSLGARLEPVTYWFAMASALDASALDRRLALLRAQLSGNIPDGILFRVSSIDSDARAAWRRQDAFIDAALDAMPSATRARVMGHPPTA